MKIRFNRFSAAVLCTAVAASSLCAMPAQTASAANLLIAEFETTDDSFTGRAGATVGWTSDQAYNVDCSLYVSGRDKAYQGAGRSAEGIMVAGQTYAMSAAVLQLTGEDVEMKFSLQYYDGTETKYSEIALKTVQSGEWTILENPAYTVPEAASDLLIYVETTESLCNFYIDTVTVSGAPAVIKKGDANGDMAVNTADAVALAKWLVQESTEIEPGGDFNGDGVINAIDLTLLKQKLLTPVVSNIDSAYWDSYQETASPAMLKVYQDGVYRVGNTARIRSKIEKAAAGEQVNIGYIGGSITGGGSSTSEAKRFVNLSYEYFKNTFGTGSNVNFVNAGEAGTSSVVGNMRVDNDIFAKNCDIIFIEFAVNDQGDNRFRKSYESLVKKCLSQPNEPAVILITLCQKSGSSNQDWMVQVGENYDLGVISGKNAIMNAISAGTLSWDANYGSGDTIHPGDGGHQLIADCIGYYYRQALKTENICTEYEIPGTEVFGADYATAKLVTNLDSLTNFSAGSWSKSGNSYVHSKNGNTPMTFTINGKGVLLLFKSNDNANMGTVLVSANGGTANKVSSNLKWTWGGRDGDCGWYQPNAGSLNISISMETVGSEFTLYGIAVIE